LSITGKAHDHAAGDEEDDADAHASARKGATSQAQKHCPSRNKQL